MWIKLPTSTSPFHSHTSTNTSHDACTPSTLLPSDSPRTTSLRFRSLPINQRVGTTIIFVLLSINRYSQTYDQQSNLRSTITPRQRCSGYRYILNKPQGHRIICSTTLLIIVINIPCSIDINHHTLIGSGRGHDWRYIFHLIIDLVYSMTLLPTVRSSPQAHHLPSLVSLCSYPIIRVTCSADMQVIERSSPDHAFPRLTSPNHRRHI
jgi:hypothetical protein